MGYDEGRLECICGTPISPETIKLLKVGDYLFEVRCDNPLCELGRIAYLEGENSSPKLKLSKLVKEYNEVLLGTEESDRRYKALAREISLFLRGDGKEI